MDEAGPNRWWRRGLAAAAGLGLAYFVLAVSIAGVFGEQRPDIALSWRSSDARANAALASQMLGGSDDASPEAIRRHARQALLRDPTAIDAVRVLATLEMQTDRDGAQRIMRYALALSRRDLATHLWFIEDSVARSSVAGALFHYDAALRTSRRANSVLLPVLVSAASQPKVVSELDRILDRDPEWRDEFLEALVQEGEHFDAWLPLPTKYLDPAEPREADLIQTLLNRLVAAREYSLAARLDNSKTGANGSASVRNGAFDQQPQFTPFDWIFVNEQGFSAQVEMHDNASDPALTLIAGSGREGPLASQLLRLQGGSYRISAKAGDVERAGQVYLTLRCIETNLPLLRVDAPKATSDGRAFQANFSVPANSCPAQWLEIGVSAGPSQTDAAPWLDAVAISRAR